MAGTNKFLGETSTPHLIELIKVALNTKASTEYVDAAIIQAINESWEAAY